MCKMERTEKTLRETWAMVKPGIWNIARAKRVAEGTWSHIVHVQLLWLSDHTNSTGLQMQPGQSLQILLHTHECE